MVLAGIAQLMAFSSCTYVLYRTLPNRVMSRVASVYQLFFQGAIVAGTCPMGVTADRFGIRIALLITGMALVAGLIAKLRFPSTSRRGGSRCIALYALGRSCSGNRARAGAWTCARYKYNTKSMRFMNMNLP